MAGPKYRKKQKNENLEKQKTSVKLAVDKHNKKTKCYYRTRDYLRPDHKKH